MYTPEQSQLGKATAYPDQYDAALLYPIARAPNRAEIGVGDTLPFLGADLWTAFELGWLNLRGKPQVALGHFTVPCETPNIVESKSFKLYLGSFNNSRFSDVDEVQARLRADLNEALWRGAPAVGAGVGVRILSPELFDREPVHELDGLNLDRLDVECTQYTPALARTASPCQSAALTSSRMRRLTSSASANAVPLKLFRYSLKDLLSMMWVLSHGTVMWAMASCGLPRGLSQDSSNAVHRSAPKKRGWPVMPMRSRCGARAMGNSSAGS